MLPAGTISHDFLNPGRWVRLPRAVGSLSSGAHKEGVPVLVGGAVFNTVEAEDLGLGGSIPLRLRYQQVCSFPSPGWRPGKAPKSAFVDFAWT